MKVQRLLLFLAALAFTNHADAHSNLDEKTNRLVRAIAEKLVRNHIPWIGNASSLEVKNTEIVNVRTSEIKIGDQNFALVCGSAYYAGFADSRFLLELELRSGKSIPILRKFVIEDPTTPSAYWKTVDVNWNACETSP